MATILASGDQGALADRFGARLQFGTAGLRGELGAGPNRMNRLLVRRTAAGLAGYLGAGRAVVVGYDARHKSVEFAHDSAAVLTGAGLRASVLPRALPTPVLAFAVRWLHADAGVMVTASHNPRGDNGYKVYLGDGAQIVPPADTDISAAIDAVRDIPWAEGYEVLGDEVVTAYVEGATRLVPERPAAALRVVYTPLHGVGRDVLTEVFARSGFAPLHVVAEQAEPDPAFPTVAFPNPEEPGVLDLAIAAAAREGADLILANDPDADRLAVAVPDRAAHGGWRRLTGDEVGCLLAEHLLSSPGPGGDRLVVTTVVSSTLLAKIAAAHGVHHERTLTGFKWIVRPALAHPEWRFVLGYEEALGYCVGDLVRDKDGITAALAFAGLAAGLRASGRTVLDALDDLARRHGRHATALWPVRLPPSGQAEVLARVRAGAPASLAGLAVRSVDDLAPRADVVVVELDGGRVVVRPSGTEPKLKIYFEVVVDPDDDPAPLLASLRGAVATWAGLPS